MDVRDGLRALEGYLSATPEFNALKQAKAALNKDPSAAALLAQFQSKQKAAYSQNGSPEQLQRYMAQLSSEYENLMKVPLIRQYYTAADTFNNLLGQVVQQLNTSLEALLEA